TGPAQRSAAVVDGRPSSFSKTPFVEATPSARGKSHRLVSFRAGRTRGRDREAPGGDPGGTGARRRILPETHRADDRALRGAGGHRGFESRRDGQRGAGLEDRGDTPPGGSLRPVGLLSGQGNQGRHGGGLTHVLARDL